MPLVDSTRLTALRTRVSDALLSTTATIYSRTLASDSEGGQTETWATVRASGVACIVSRQEQDEDVIEGGKPTNPQLYRIRFLSNQTIAETDRIVTGGVTYAIAGTTGVGTLAVVNRVICRKVV